MLREHHELLGRLGQQQRIVLLPPLPPPSTPSSADNVPGESLAALV
jgi:hypothetical protein